MDTIRWMIYVLATGRVMMCGEATTTRVALAAVACAQEVDSAVLILPDYAAPNTREGTVVRGSADMSAVGAIIQSLDIIHKRQIDLRVEADEFEAFDDADLRYRYAAYTAARRSEARASSTST